MTTGKVRVFSEAQAVLGVRGIWREKFKDKLTRAQAEHNVGSGKKCSATFKSRKQGR